MPFASAAAGGLATALAFPGVGWWPLLFVGVPLLMAAMTTRRLGVALSASALGGGVFWGVHVFWLTVYLGPAPWLGLAGLQTLFFVVGGAATWAVHRALNREAGVRRLLLVPAALAAIWAAREWVTGVWPYGGFGWGKLAYSQSESPFAELIGWTGATGMSFVLAFLAGVLLQSVRYRSTAPARGGYVAMVLVLAAALVPAFPVASSGTLRVGAVQGNSEAGLLAVNQPGRILEDHQRAATPLLAEDLDLLVLPENVADLSPLDDPGAADAIDGLSRLVRAPVLLGTITRSGDDTYNSALVWEEGDTVAQYDKKHPVPFAEYLPDREFWFPLAPDLFSLIPRDFSFGERSNVLDIGDVRAGVAICYDIVDDALIREMIAGGAQVIISPTNNADFGRTDQSAQQLAIARLRAIESGRSLVNASTVGVSAMISPDGRTIEGLTPFTPGAMVNDVPLSATVTPAMAFGDAVEILLVGAGAMLVAGATLRMPGGGRKRASANGER